MAVLWVLFLAILPVFHRVGAYARDLEFHPHVATALQSHTLPSHTQKAQQLFNDLVDQAEDVYSSFEAEAAAIAQIRTAFLLCPNCPYQGSRISFFHELFSVDGLVDRKYLTDQIFPALLDHISSPNVLWVGVRPYSMRYEYILTAAGAQFTTIEPNKDVKLYGSSQQHFVDFAQNIDQRVGVDTYDVIIINGVIGWGIDTREQITEFMFAAQRVMKTRGILIIGYNQHIGSDHTCCYEPHFKKANLGGLPQKKEFTEEWKHTYEIFEKL